MGSQYLFEFTSLECRWFLEKPVPKEFELIFKEVPVDVRTDVYWVKDFKNNPNALNQGIKLREGRFETKTKTNVYRIPEIPAIVQQWKKTGEVIPQELNLQKDWLEIPKKRQLINYRIEDGILSKASEYSPEGCNFELTHFGPPFEKYSTIGLEAFGTEENLQKYLSITYAEISNTSVIEQIVSLKISKSYPEWIAELKEIWKS